MFFRSSRSSQKRDDAILQYIDGLYSYALVLARNRSDAEDLVQETYLRAMRAMGRLRAGSNVKGWLFTILRNIWLNQLRQRHVAQEVPVIDLDQYTAEAPSGISEDPHSLLVSKIDREQVQDAIQQLPLEFREI